MARICILFSLFFFTLTGFSQDVAIGGWKEHLSYKNAISVAEGNGKVYVATTSGIFFMNKSDNSLDRMSKVTGLSDIEATVLNFNPYNNAVLIAYKNSNIDIVLNGSIVNISDIKRKSIIGNKSINNIYFVNQYAYLACGFGIVVIDMDRLEVKDTYFIGPGGNSINVTDLTTEGVDIYASTSSGIYKAALSNPNLANYTSWTKMPMAGVPFPNGFYNTIAAFNGKVYANYSKYLTNGNMYQDSIYVYDPTFNTWGTVSYHPGSYETTYQLRQNNNQLLIVQEGGVGGTFGFYGGYFSDYARPRSAALDNAGNLWIADTKYGLVFKKAGSTYDHTYPNGPASPKVYGMALSQSNLWVAPGGKATYFADGLYQYTEGEWKNPRGNYAGAVNLDTVLDFVDVAVDPNNSKRSFGSSWGMGVVEFYNGAPVKDYNETNSSLRGVGLTGFNPIWTYGMAFDANGNLWVTNSHTKRSVSVMNPSGAWQSIDFTNEVGNIPYLGKILIDKNDQKWILVTTGGGLLVYKGGITADGNSSNARKMTSAAGNGALPSDDVYSIAEDKNGEIWIGTDKGIGVFYSPENVFTGGNFDAQQILIQQDGHVQILLETETVQAIAVDDANRKWIGTAKSGVFLMSADGTTELQHFTEDNSPLLSNNIKGIVIDHLTGEIYIGTDKGIVSYRGSAIAGKDCFEDVYSFPNPVKPGYEGPIAIKGLMDNTTVKITDISGSLVYQVKSEGGQAIWYGKNFNGERVSSGVYMVFCTSEDNSCQKIATKILLVN